MHWLVISLLFLSTTLIVELSNPSARIDVLVSLTTGRSSLTTGAVPPPPSPPLLQDVMISTVSVAPNSKIFFIRCKDWGYKSDVKCKKNNVNGKFFNRGILKTVYF